LLKVLRSKLFWVRFKKFGIWGNHHEKIS
jgi:hypothetical protein